MKRRLSINMSDPENGDKIIMSLVYLVIGVMAFMGVIKILAPEPTCHNNAHHEERTDNSNK